MSDLHDAIAKHYQAEQAAVDAEKAKGLDGFRVDDELEAMAAAIEDDTKHSRGVWPAEELARVTAYLNRKRQAQAHRGRHTEGAAS